jgi:2-polyprenyl-6-methoxyphenol hydroxylase-like FAD-dependent oxidoreductase
VLESGSYKQFYMHRAGHWLGMDVHDAGLYQVKGASQKLAPGMVLTVEPGTYIRPADNVPGAFWNIGVRIEDDVLVTATARESHAPRRPRRSPKSKPPAAMRSDHARYGRRAARCPSQFASARCRIVGAGPVGGTLALAIARSGLSIVALDAREAGSTLRGDRSLAISHGAASSSSASASSRARGDAGAVTPITAIDISQARLRHATLSAEEHALPALGYVISYRALQSAIDAALARTRIEFAMRERTWRGRRHARVPVERRARRRCARALAVVADGRARRSRRRARAARLRPGRAVAKVTTAAHGGVAYERFTTSGPWRCCRGRSLRARVDDDAASGAARSDGRDARFCASCRRHFGARRTTSRRVASARPFRSRSSSRRPRSRRAVLVGNAAQSLHPIAGKASTSACATRSSSPQAINDAPRDRLGEHACSPRYAARRARSLRGRRVHARLTHIFALDGAIFALAARIALAMLDALPPRSARSRARCSSASPERAFARATPVSSASRASIARA